MLPEVEYRSVIKHFVKKKLCGKEILEELQSVYGSESPSKTSVYFWVSEFKNGRSSVTDEPQTPLRLQTALGVRQKFLSQKVMICYPLF